MKRLLKWVDDAYMGFLFWATSTKTAAYILTICIALSVAMDPPQNIQAALLVVVSVYYQGVALPAIGAASKRAEQVAREEGEANRKLLQETHDAVMEELRLTREQNAKLEAIVMELHTKHDDLKTNHLALVNTLQRYVEGSEEIV